MGFIKVVIYVIVILILGVIGYWIYSNFLATQIENIGFGTYNPNIQGSLINVSSDVEQFYSNMRFNHNNIKYYMQETCGQEKIIKMKRAFDILHDQTQVLSFEQTTEAEAEILIGCSSDFYEKEKNIFIAGEGGPTQIVNSSLAVILKGKILLYNESRGSCEKPVLELHELLHVFGYEHINQSNYIMYPYLNCDQEINPDLLNHIKELYAIPSFADVYFEEIDAYKERYFGRWYLGFNTSIKNIGIIDAEETRLEIYEGDTRKGDFKLEVVEFGGGKKFIVSGFIINGDKEVSLKLSTSSYENNKQNNIILLEI
jgi:hypothetical protein